MVVDETSKILISVYTTIIAAVLAGIVAIIVCAINNWYAKKKIDNDQINFLKTLEANSEKLTADLYAQSSKTYKELITTERIKWVNALRESMAELLSRYQEIGLLKIQIAEEERTQNMVINHTDKIREIGKYEFLVKLRLNPKEKEFLEQLETVSKKVVGARTLESLVAADNAVQEFSNSCQILLKKEWDHIKEEAKPIKISDH